MRTHTIQLYTFSELSEKAQAKAIEEHRFDFVESFDWWDCAQCNFLEDLEEYGFLNAKLDCSYGHYTFEADYDYAKLLSHFPKKAILEPIVEDLSYFVEGNWYEVDKAMHTVEQSVIATEFVEWLEELKRELCKGYKRTLEEEESYLTSDEKIREDFEVNENEFTIEGELYG